MNKGTKPKRYDWVFMSIVRALRKNPIHSLAQSEQKGILQYLLSITFNFHTGQSCRVHSSVQRGPAGSWAPAILGYWEMHPKRTPKDAPQRKEHSGAGQSLGGLNSGTWILRAASVGPLPTTRSSGLGGWVEPARRASYLVGWLVS